MENQKSQSGCLPFIFGFFTGIICIPILFMGLIIGGFYMTKNYIGRKIESNYSQSIRSQILVNLPFPKENNQRIMKKMDHLVYDFDQMNTAEKKQAMEDLMKEFEMMDLQK